MFASYSQTLAEKLSVATLRLIQSPWYQRYWGDRFRLVSENMRKFENDKGGYRLSTSAGGTATGEGGMVVVIDDPLNAIDANSQTERDNVIRWWDESLPTRLNNQIEGAYVVIMQRLHEDDLAGHIIRTAKEHWDWLVIPMRYELGWDELRTTSLGWTDPRTEQGELLCAERWPRHILDPMEARMGPWASGAQHQQTPVPRGGGIVQPEWWQLYDEESAKAECGVAPTAGLALAYPPLSYVVVSVDTAYKEGEQNDYNACSAWGVWHNSKGWPRVVMLEAWHWRGPLRALRLEGQERIEAEEAERSRRPGTFPNHWGLAERVLDTARRRRADIILIEDKTRSVDLNNEIRDQLKPGEMTVRLEPVVGDKVTRLHATVPLFTDKMVWAPDKAWAQLLIDEVSAVPKGRHDDLADTAAQALIYLRANHLVRLGTEADEEEQERARFRPMAQAPYDV